jgi:hypothetical protein
MTAEKDGGQAHRPVPGGAQRKRRLLGGSRLFVECVKNKDQIPDTPNPSRGIIATGPAISRSFDLGGRFLPETPKAGSSLWARFFLAMVRNGKTEMVSTATIVNPQGPANIFDQNGVDWTLRSNLSPISHDIFDVTVKC